MKLYRHLFIIENLTAEVDSFSTNYTPDIMQVDSVVFVFIYLCVTLVQYCPPFQGKQRKSRRTFIFTPQHGLCLLPEPHYELRMSVGF